MTLASSRVSITGPLPRMVYLDSSAKPGVDHVYTVTALSSAGVPSDPGAFSAEMRSPTGKLNRPTHGASASSRRERVVG